MSTFARSPEEAYENDAHDPLLDDWFAGRHRGREHSRRELEALVRALALRPDLWRGWVAHSPVERIYTRLHLDENLEVWLICWSRLQDTGFHDHDRSRGAVAVVDGAVAERRLGVGPVTPATAVHGVGSTFSFGAAHIHDVSQTGPEPGDVAPRVLSAAGSDGLLRGGRRRAPVAPGRRRGGGVLLRSDVGARVPGDPRPSLAGRHDIETSSSRSSSVGLIVDPTTSLRDR